MGYSLFPTVNKEIGNRCKEIANSISHEAGNFASGNKYIQFMKRSISLFLIALVTAISINAKTLIVYYSYTNNIHRVMTELQTQIDADVIRVEPAEKGLDYAANNYAIGSAQISAIRNNPDDEASYPAIDPVDVDLSQYSTIIIGAPLWWSNMAAPLQTFLFKYGKEMAGKNIGLIVSSASSGISGVESDAKRLIPDGIFLSPSLWIRSSQTPNAGQMIENWLKEIHYSEVAGISEVSNDRNLTDTKVYDTNGIMVAQSSSDLSSLAPGLYIMNRKKILVGHR